MSIFYKNTSKRHLRKLVEEKDYYLANADSHSGESEKGYRLMADFYSVLIEAAEKHIQDNSQEKKS